MDTPQFRVTFTPNVAEPRFIFCNKSLIADPEGFVADTLTQLSSLDTVAESFMYAGSTPQTGGRRSAYVGPMGDGRAAVLGTVVMADTGDKWILQAKGLRTPITEPPKDGSASVDEGVNELVVSEHLAALGSPSCRVLGLVSVPGRVSRRGCAVAPRVIVLRAAPQFWRCGTMEHLFYANDHEGLREVVLSTLQAGWASDRPFSRLGLDETRPEIDGEAAETEATWGILDPGELHTWSDGREARPEDIPAAISFLRGVVECTAVLAASWQINGFIHGMLRSDNVLLSGAAIDVGATSRFRHGVEEGSSRPREPMYAFEQQPSAFAAHMKQLATTLSLLVPNTRQLEEELCRFWPTYRAAFRVEALASVNHAALDDDALIHLLSLARACCSGDETSIAKARHAVLPCLAESPLLHRIAEMFS